jgi:hypothetical protein
VAGTANAAYLQIQIQLSGVSAYPDGPCDSSVGIATGYGMDGSGIESR